MNNLSIADVENILLQIKQCEILIDAEKQKCIQSVSFYQQFIDRAKKIFDEQTNDARLEIDLLKAKLQSYFDANPPAKRKSLKFAGGSFGYNKSQTKFFLNGSECNADNKDLLALCKNTAPECYKVKEYVDWAKLKSAIDFADTDTVFFKDSGEVINGLRAQKIFSVKTF